MVVFEVKKVFPQRKDLLKEYFMCYRTWALGMPYKVVNIKPREKCIWDWEIIDAIDFIIIKWDFKHKFTSIQKEHEHYLKIDFENSNYISEFDGEITFKEKVNNEDGSVKCLVKFIIKKLRLKDPLLNKLRDPFIGIMKADYKKFLDNVYDILQDKKIRDDVIKGCWWARKEVITF
ncbi:MAG: hypothetical protein ACTSPY_16155 [Candidatus Helarchaeota archaeon]